MVEYERTRPVFKELTDDFVATMEKPEAIDAGGFCRMIHLVGLPEGVDPEDERVKAICAKIDAQFGGEGGGRR